MDIFKGAVERNSEGDIGGLLVLQGWTVLALDTEAGTLRVAALSFVDLGLPSRTWNVGTGDSLVAELALGLRVLLLILRERPSPNNHFGVASRRTVSRRNVINADSGLAVFQEVLLNRLWLGLVLGRLWWRC